ncbi:MAG: nucleotidyltransferase family protein [Chloroflexota bacterium]
MSDVEKILGVVLAAGASSRMGTSKMALPWDEVSILETTLAHVSGSGVEDILLVTGGHRELVESLPCVAGIEQIFNADYAAGEMISSIKLALQKILSSPNLPDAIFVLPGDMPFVTAEIIDQIIGIWRKSPEYIVAPQHSGKRGHPVLFPFEIFKEFETLSAESVPRDLLKKHKLLLRLVEISDPAVLIDIDTPEAYAKYRPLSG